MDNLTEALDFLSWSTKAVNHVRSTLAEVNVPLPAFLAQLLALFVLGLVGWFLLGAARKPERSLQRLAARVALIAVGVGAVSIVAAWVDSLAVPRSHEIVGQLAGSHPAEFQVDLLDYRDRSLGARVQTDSHGRFVVGYTPEFADPPSALLVQVPGCGERRQPLTRAHLLGAVLTVQMRCGGSGD